MSALPSTPALDCAELCLYGTALHDPYDAISAPPSARCAAITYCYCYEQRKEATLRSPLATIGAHCMT